MADVASGLHGWGHDDYEVAKRHIFDQLGSFDGLEVFGKQVLVAVYVRPAMNPRTGLTFTEKRQMEDWVQGKVVMVVMHGPDAFSGDEDFVNGMWGPNGPPKVGQWLFVNPAQGQQFSFQGDGSIRVKYLDRHDESHDLYPGDGWPVRILQDDAFLGRLIRPTSVV